MQSKLFAALSLFVVAATAVTSVKAAATTTPKATITTASAKASAVNSALYSVSPHATPQPAIACPGGCTWPALDVPPAPLPEWVAAVDMSKVPSAPVIKLDASGNPINPGYTAASDTYCSWSYTQCFRATDIYQCPKGIWGLTYDDGPQPPSPALYNFLKSQNQRATHFIIGSRALEYPDALRQVYQNGGQIAVHTWSHPWLTTQTNEQIIGEMMWTAKVIQAILGITPLYMRPPHGDLDDRVRAIMAQLNMKVVQWDYDTNDWMTGSPIYNFQPEWIYQNFTVWAKTISTATTGSISLEHELSDESVYEAMKSYPLLTAAGWKIMPVADCMNDPYYYVEQLNGSLAIVSGAPTPTGGAPTKAASAASATGTAAAAGVSNSSTNTTKASAAVPRSASLAATVAVLSFVVAALAL
jgi:peptidoglycan/xylan/chitin deacetylase (PgdA/CDA1 family)